MKQGQLIALFEASEARTANRVLSEARTANRVSEARTANRVVREKQGRLIALFG